MNLFDDGIFIDMAKSKKSIPKPTSRKTVLKRNKRNKEAWEGERNNKEGGEKGVEKVMKQEVREKKNKIKKKVGGKKE